jgi:hypothetical protein
MINRGDMLLDMASDSLIEEDDYNTKNAALRFNPKKIQEEQARTAYRVRNWYEVDIYTIEKLTYAGEKIVTVSEAVRKTYCSRLFRT